MLTNGKTQTVIHWFKSIEQKSRCFFIQFAVIEFYPSMTENILQEVIICQATHRDCRKRPQNYSALQEISPLLWQWSMEKERIRELLWCYNGKQPWHLNLWTYWNLYFITAFKSFTTRKHWLILGRWSDITSKHRWTINK